MERKHGLRAFDVEDRSWAYRYSGCTDFVDATSETSQSTYLGTELAGKRKAEEQGR